MKLTDRIRYVEKTGASLANRLTRKDPWKTGCGRAECMTCDQTPGACMKKNTIYMIECMTCMEEGNKTQYIGETSRSTYERMEEHRNMMEKIKTESPLIEHHLEKHEKQEPNFRAKVVLSVRKPLERQCREGYLIGNPPDGVNLMNRKGEWGQNLPPNFTYD